VFNLTIQIIKKFEFKFLNIFYIKNYFKLKIILNISYINDQLKKKVVPGNFEVKKKTSSISAKESLVSNLGKPMLAKKHSSHLSSHLSFNKTSAYSSHHFFKTNKKTNKKIIKRIKGKSFLLYIYKKNGVK